MGRMYRGPFPWRWIVFLFVLGGFVVGCGSGESGGGEEQRITGGSAIPDSMTIVRMLESDDRFSTLRTALDSTGQDSLLATTGPFTLFAPPNAAFEALPPGTIVTLLADQHSRLRTILAHHVVEGRILVKDLSTGQTVTTLYGDTLTLRPGQDEVTAEGVSVLDGDIEAANGLIHVVERVLPPPDEDSSP